MNKRLLLILFTFLIFTLANAKEVKLLTIGNSFADSAFKFLPQSAESVPDCKLIMERANHGGCELDRHWSYVEREEADSNVKLYRGNTATLKSILKSKKWDFITIQQASHKSWQSDSYQPYAKNLSKYAKANASTAEIVIQQTWSYRADDPRIMKGGQWKFDQDGMYERLKAAYAKCAKELNLRVIPTGLAVQTARAKQPKRFVNYDKSILKTLKYPELPDQTGSIVGKLYWKKDKKTSEMKIVRDSIHLNERGEYLQACVWFGFFFEKDPTLISFVPKNLDSKDAEFLRNIAKQVLLEFKQPRDEK